MTCHNWIHTEQGPRKVNDLIGKPFTAVFEGRSYTAAGLAKSGFKKAFTIYTDRGYELSIADHHSLLVEVGRKQRFRRINGRMQRSGHDRNLEWVKGSSLQVGCSLVLANHVRSSIWGGHGSFNEGWLVGSLVGDGGYNPEKYSAYLRFWGEQKAWMAEHALELVKALPFDGPRPIELSKPRSEGNGQITVASRALDQLVDSLLMPGSKASLPMLEYSSSRFHRGFLRGLFDADGSVQGSVEKGVSVRLSQSNLERLKVVQRMLARLGVISSIYVDRRKAHKRRLPDGKGGSNLYECRAQHELVVSRTNLVTFMEQVGFLDNDKAKRLSTGVLDRKRGHYAERFTAKVVSIEEHSPETAYDCPADEEHCLDVNGIGARCCP